MRMTMATFTYYVMYVHTFIFFLTVSELVNGVRIKLTTYVNPIEENGILSIHCQIWELESDHEVSIFRNPHGEKLERLTVGDEVANVVDDDRVFLATRKPVGGSTIYFLSVMEVTKHDAGDYSCRIMGTTDDGSFNEIAAETLAMDVMYFPDENMNPSCITVSEEPSDGRYVVEPGKPLVLKCQSNKGNPPVKIKWTNNADGYINPQDITFGEDGDSIYSEITIKSSANEIKALFICGITSEQFPDKTKTCHKGPVVIKKDPNAPILQDDNVDFPVLESTTKTTAISVPKHPKHPNIVEVPDDAYLTCKQECSSLTESTIYWIIATIATFIFAIILFITCITLFIRYNRLPSYQQPPCMPRNRDDIYTELDCKRNDNKMYLAIEKRDNKEHNISDIEEFHYVSPNVPNMQTQLQLQQC